jgi:hypothetical protein
MTREGEMDMDQVECAVCGTAMAYDDAYGSIEYEGQMCHACCRGCMEKLKSDPAAYLK